VAAFVVSQETFLIGVDERQVEAAVSVLSAGPRRSSIFVATPATCQWRWAVGTIETSISQLRTLPSGVPARAQWQAAVACVGTDPEIAPNAQHAREERREVGLLRRKQHVYPGQLGANTLEGGMLPRANLHSVVVERVCQAEPFAGSWQLARRWCVGCATAHVAVRAARVRGVRYSGCSDERLLHPRKAGAPWARL
jgi:hypothetical protein